VRGNERGGIAVIAPFPFVTAGCRWELPNARSASSYPFWLVLMAVGLLWRSFRFGPLADTVLIEINAVP
jgi:hypothetical protein